MFENLTSTTFYQLPKLINRVFDAGNYETLDYDLVNTIFTNALNPFNGGCTAFSTTIDNGNRIVGRNLDFYMSEKPAYICRTATKEGYKTLGVAYNNMFSPSYKEVLEKGVPEIIHKMIPFCCTDILNEKGLFVEINMRLGEVDKNENQKYTCSGTNPTSKKRIEAILLQRYIAQNCATVEEAVKYCNSLDIFTPTVPGKEWNFCFLMADAQGGYGVLEIAKNKVIWLDQQAVQTNFYINEECNKDEDFKCGIGRYQVIENGIPFVHDEKDALNLMKQVAYSQTYTPETSAFDVRSEFVGAYPEWTTDFVVDPKNKETVLKYIKNLEDNRMNMDISTNTTYWNTSYTNIVNVNKKTMSLLFFEDDSITLDLEF